MARRPLFFFWGFGGGGHCRELGARVFPISLNELHHSIPRQVVAGLQYALYRGGPMSGNGLYVGALVRSDEGLERPDLQLNISAWSTIDRTRDGIISHPFPGFAISPVHLRPEGRGTLRVKTAK